MKAWCFLIIVVAALLGWRQSREAGRLATREKQLLAVAGATHPAPYPQDGRSTDANAGTAAKTERGPKQSFDAKLYLEKFRKLSEAMAQREPDIGEDDFIKEDLLDASADDILMMVAMIRDAGIPAEYAGIIYECASPRLLDKDPATACEFSMKGGDITNFILIMRTWISRNPVAAGEWLEMKAKANPPLNEKSFATDNSHRKPLDVASLQLAARIAASPSNAELDGLTKLEGAKLTATLQDVLAVLAPDGLPVLLKRLGTSGREDLVELAITQHPEPALAREYLKNAGLPPGSFAKVAQAAISQLDPASLPNGMGWYLKSTDPKSRSQGLRELVKGWAHENPKSAAEWISTLPEGADRSQAEEAYQEALAHPRPKKERKP